MLTIDFANVLGEIPAAGVPSAVFADGKGTSGDALGGIPHEEPLEGAADGIDGGDLQVAPVDEAQVAGNAAVGCHLFGGAPPHGVVGAFDYGVARVIREAHGAIFGVVLHCPDTGGGFHQRLVAIGIEGGCELTHGCVLIEVAGRIRGAIFALCGGGAVADVVVAIAVVDAVDGGACQLRPGVITEAVAARGLTAAGGAAGERATQRIIGVGSLSHESGTTSMISHADE